MKIAIWLMALALATVVSAAALRAEDPPPTATGGTAGGIKELPGTMKKDVGDAVKKDMGLGAPTAPSKPAATDTDDADDANDDEEDE
jgi:hypothetical protein